MPVDSPPSSEHLLQVALGKCNEAEYCLARAQKNSNDPALIQRAMDLYADVLAMDIEVAEVYLGIAILAFGSGRSEEAMGLLAQAERIDPANLRVSQMRSRFIKARARALPAGDQAPAPLKVASLRAQVPQVQPPAALNASSADSPDHSAANEVEQSPDQALPTTISVVLGPPESKMYARGPQVRLLQSWLQSLGCRVSLSGEYDKATLQAIQALQMKHKLKISGLVDRKTVALLEQLLAKQQAQASLQALQQSVPLDPAKLTLARPGTKDALSEGPLVSTLQQNLSALGFRVELTSVFDQATFAAVRSLQSRHRLPITGAVDPATHRLLASLGAARRAQAGAEERILDALAESAETGEGFDDQRLEACQRMLSRIWSQLEAQAQPQQPRTGKAASSAEGQQRESLQARLETGLREVCGAAGWQAPAQLADWSAQLIALALGADYEAIMAENLTISEIQTELGPAGRPERLSEGPEVELLQFWLRRLDYSLELSSVYDPPTAQAVRQFQTQHKLPMTGICDSRTAAAVRNAVQHSESKE